MGRSTQLLRILARASRVISPAPEATRQSSFSSPRSPECERSRHFQVRCQVRRAGRGRLRLLLQAHKLMIAHEIRTCLWLLYLSLSLSFLSPPLPISIPTRVASPPPICPVVTCCATLQREQALGDLRAGPYLTRAPRGWRVWFSVRSRQAARWPPLPCLPPTVRDCPSSRRQLCPRKKLSRSMRTIVTILALNLRRACGDSVVGKEVVSSLFRFAWTNE